MHRVIELFAGCGGMALGFRLAGFRTVMANEMDRHACDTLRANITTDVVCCDIQDIQSFPAADVVAGGPPCQGFSALGSRNASDPRNQLWREYFRCVEQAQPKVFVLENVPRAAFCRPKEAPCTTAKANGLIRAPQPRTIL